MLGELQPVWSEVWREIWVPLSKQPDAPVDLWTALFAELVPPPGKPPEPAAPTEFDADGLAVMQLADIDANERYKADLADYQRTRDWYESVATGSAPARPALRLALPAIGATEEGARAALEAAFDTVNAYGLESLSNRYFILTSDFIERYSLRYDLRRPFTFHPTPTGVFAKLFAEIALSCRQDAALSALLRDYLEAFQDLRHGPTPGRITTCLQKQVNLLEGVTSLSDGVTETTLGKMCNQVKTWPSTAVSEAAKAMYGFASDHTGLRHGTIKKAKEGKTPTVHRDMEIRDLVAVSAFFTGMTAYLSDRIDPAKIYGL